MTSDAVARTYYLDIPTTYNFNTPYRLIFSMHCMGASDTADVSQNYYDLKTEANNANIQCIFVAPEGYTNGMPWSTTDARDHIFVDDMLSLFKDSLCVDTTRVFCAGFSFGAMFSYSLSLDHQKQFRAIATYEPANYNIYLPTNLHLPCAYWTMTGVSDGTCPYVNSAADSEGGKYCVLDHVRDNGCTVPDSIVVTYAGSKTHITDTLHACETGYPVLFSSFDGVHQCYPVDGTSGTDNESQSWVPPAVWKFFSKF